MTRLRDWLGVPRQDLVAGSGTYTLAIEPRDVDLSRFHLAATAALATAEPRALVDATDEALTAWVGPPWPGLSSPRLDLARGHALARHRRVVEARTRALLALERPDEAVEAVTPLAVEHPEQEVWHALLVRALHAAGRPGEAIDAFLAARRRLHDELAVDPGEELRNAYRAVLVERSRLRSEEPRPYLVGRDDVLATIVAARVDDGSHGPVVLVEGEAGIGKSLVLAAARYVARRDAQVVDGAWDEGSAPLAGWVDALGPPPPGPAGAPVPWVRQRLAELAADGPVLVTLDDAHRADSASFAAITDIARHGLPPGVVVLISACAPAPGVSLGWELCRADLARDTSVMRVELGQLDGTAVRQLARRRLVSFGPEAADRLARLLYQQTAGHPLHVTALLDVLATCHDEAAAAAAVRTVPPRLRAFVDRQLDRLRPATRRTVEALAVLRPVPPGALAVALDRPSRAVAEDLREAASRGLVADGDLRHEVVAVAVRDRVPETIRVAWHAAWLEHLGPDDDAFLRLRHTLGAAPLLDDATVARARRDAGVVAYERRALTEASALLDAAARVLSEDPVVEVHRGLVLGALGRAREADDLLDEAIGAAMTAPADPGLVVKAAVGDESVERPGRGDARRRARLDRAELVPSPSAVRFDLLVAMLREQSFDGVARPELVAEMRALAGAEDAPTTMRARARALEVRQLLEGPVPAAHRVDLAAEGLELARLGGDPTVVLDATELMLTAALSAGQVDQALGLRRTLAVEAHRWHRPRLVWAAHVLESSVLLARGDDEAADHAASASLQLGQDLGVDDARAAFAVHLVVRAWIGGTLAGLCDLTEQAARDHPAMPAWAAVAAAARACAGRYDEASALLAEFRARRAATDSRRFDRPGLCFAACAAWSTGDLETARIVRAELPADPDAVVILGYGAVITGPAALFAGIAAMALGDVAQARADVSVAEKLAVGLGWTPWVDAAARVGAHLDGAAVELPLGLGRRRTARD
ncbi:BTAD domain-containing putative transcriptional regulator [Actinomycetospora atypica]|uniref:BTAD domain-containing putative transcriptional regulator n=1 Tax=Actinomycetospora atypica TaxID=1290095 RepID=A0ABV9YG40_9PSEU